MYKVIGADGKEYGPITADVLRQWIAEGRANADTRVLPENATEWKLLRDLPEFAAALGSTPQAPAPAPLSSLSSYSEPRKNNPLALTGLILGILSITLGLCCCSGFPFSIPGVICSAIALSQLSKNPQQEGKGLAMTGLVLSIVGILLGIGIMIFWGLAGGMQELIRKVQNL